MTIPTVQTVKDPKMAKGEISPKVSIPSLILFGLGVILVLVHVFTSDPNSVLLDIGLTAIGASGVTGGVGWVAKVGRVLMPTNPTNPEV